MWAFPSAGLSSLSFFSLSPKKKDAASIPNAQSHRCIFKIIIKFKNAQQVRQYLANFKIVFTTTMAKPKILLIDNDPKILRSYKDTLKVLEATVTTSKLVTSESFKEPAPAIVFINSALEIPNSVLNAETQVVLLGNFNDAKKRMTIDPQPANLLTTATLLLEFHRLQQKQTESQERVAAIQSKLDQTVADFDFFGYIVSHDLRGPLRALNGYSQILIEDQSDKLSEQSVKMLNRIRSNVGKLESQLDDLLELSRVNRSEIKLEKVDLEKVVRQVLKSAAKKYELEITVTGPVYADKQLMQQLIRQLLSNALKFAKTDELLKIHVGEKDNSFFIRDNGIGFEMQYAAKLFDVFSKLHPSSEFEGNGIGLAIARSIVNKHNGEISIESAPDIGTTVLVTLPKKSA